MVGRDEGSEVGVISSEGRAEADELDMIRDDPDVGEVTEEGMASDPVGRRGTSTGPPTFVPATDAMLEIDIPLVLRPQNDRFAGAMNSFGASASGSPSIDRSVPHQSDPFSSLGGSGLDSPMGRRRVVEMRMEEEERWEVRLRESWKRREVVVSLKGWDATRWV